MTFEFGGFETRNETETIDFIKMMITIAKKINTEELNPINIMSFVGLGTCLADMKEWDNKDFNHYKEVLIELLDTYQCKLEEATKKKEGIDGNII